MKFGDIDGTPENIGWPGNPPGWPGMPKAPGANMAGLKFIGIVIWLGVPGALSSSKTGAGPWMTFPSWNTSILVSA